MDISELKDIYQTKDLVSKAEGAFESLLENNPEIMIELNLQQDQTLKLVHRETSIVFFNQKGYGKEVIKYSFDILIEGKKISVGYFKYLIDLKMDFVDEFLVFK